MVTATSFFRYLLTLSSLLPIFPFIHILHVDVVFVLSIEPMVLYEHDSKLCKLHIYYYYNRSRVYVHHHSC